jgi:hypothetical protein
MRRRLALLFATAALAFGVGVHAPTASPAPAAAVKTCSASYVLAHLSWGDKCLRAGQFCKVGNKEYLRYGFTCPATGHLRRR